MRRLCSSYCAQVEKFNSRRPENTDNVAITRLAKEVDNYAVGCDTHERNLFANKLLQLGIEFCKCHGSLGYASRTKKRHRAIDYTSEPLTSRCLRRTIRRELTNESEKKRGRYKTERLPTIKHFVYFYHGSGFGVTYLPRFFSLSQRPAAGSGS